MKKRLPVIRESYEVFFSYIGPDGYWLRATRIVTVEGRVKHPSEARNWHDRAAAMVSSEFKRGDVCIDKVVYQ